MSTYNKTLAAEAYAEFLQADDVYSLQEMHVSYYPIIEFAAAFVVCLCAFGCASKTIIQKNRIVFFFTTH